MVNKKQLGLLTDFVSWISSGALEDPFYYFIKDGIIHYEKSTYYKLKNPWPDFENDLQALIDSDYINKVIIDGKTNYTLTDAGRKATEL